jgi:hypothetical protein
MRKTVAKSVLRQLAAAIDANAPAKRSAAKKRRTPALQRFLEQDTTTDAGGAWSLKDHEPFKPIIDAISETVAKRIPNRAFALMKGEQIGATHSIGIGPAIYLASECKLNVGYFLPDKTLAGRIGTRLRSVIKRSAYLREQMRDREQTNQTLMKEFPNGAYLHILPLGTMSGAINTPLDVRLYDEVDMLPVENKELSEGRTAHSKLNLEIALSAPYAPGAGIDLLYSEGTKNRWLVDCGKCKRKKIDLEETFLETEGQIIRLVRGAWCLVCPDCFSPLDVVKNGRFVAAQPKAKVVSWRVSKLSVPAMDREQIHDRYDKAKKKKSKLARFKRTDLAIADAGANQPFDPTMLAKMQSGEVKRLTLGSSSLPRFCGMDMGDTCHFLSYERLPNGEPHLVYLKEFDVDTVETDAPALFAKLFGAAWVIDKMPQTAKARAIAYRGFMRTPRIALMDFPENSALKLDNEEHEGKRYHSVKFDRNQALEEMTDEFTDDSLFLRIPDLESDPLLETFAKHLGNLRTEEDHDAKGRLIHKFLKGVENHFGLALLYAYIAEKMAPPIMPFDFWSIDDPEIPDDDETRSGRRLPA